MTYLKATTATAFCLAFLALAPVASAASLTEIATEQGTKLFTSEMKRDKNVNNGGQRGNDVFLRNGSGFAGPSFGVNWGASGSTYDWMLSYDGDLATLDFAGTTRTIDVAPDGNWNAFQFFVRASDANRFDTATTTVTVDEVNGSALATALSLSATDGSFDKAFRLHDFATIEGLKGTLTFDFVVKAGAAGSPNSRLALNVKGLDVAAVPVPAALPLMLGGLGGLGLLARRRRAAA